MKRFLIALTAVSACLLVTVSHGASTTVEGFDGGTDGGFTGNAFFEAAGGNPDGNAHHLGQFFFNDLRTGGLGEPANPAFLGDYSVCEAVTLSFDIKVDALTDFFGNETIRPIGFELRDRDIQGPNGDSGVFFELGAIASNIQPDWTVLSVTIDDPTSAVLPPGWIGFGDEDPNTFEPILPPGATFATVLAGVDEFQITGAVPGFFFTDVFFDVRIDNVALECAVSAGACCTNGPGTESPCEIFTESDCEGGGGVFLGAGTECVSDLECEALVVTLDSVSATAEHDGVWIRWTTLSEIDTVGFRVLRQDADGRSKALTQVGSFVSGEGNSIFGSSYEVRDDSREARHAVHYFLEDVDIFGRATRHGPFAVERGTRVRSGRASR